MKLKKNLGKVFTLNPNNNFVYEKNKNLSKELINFVNIIIDFFHENYDIQSHSIYLRGSCLDRGIDKNTLDIDIIIVHEDESLKITRLSKDHQSQIVEKMKEHCGFSIKPDVELMYTTIFISNLVLRFYSMKVWGEEDLSISTLKYSKINKFFVDYREYFFNYLISERELLNNDSLLKPYKFAKKFFRNYGIKLLLKKGKISRDVYLCYEALLEEYPEYSKQFNNFLNLFLHSENYSEQQIIDCLDEIVLIIKCIHYGKPPSYILEVYG